MRVHFIFSVLLKFMSKRYEIKLKDVFSQLNISYDHKQVEFKKKRNNKNFLINSIYLAANNANQIIQIKNTL